MSIKSKWDVILAIFDKYFIENIVSKRNVLLAIHNFSGLKSLANNSNIRSSLKFLLIQYLLLRMSTISFISCRIGKGYNLSLWMMEWCERFPVTGRQGELTSALEDVTEPRGRVWCPGTRFSVPWQSLTCVRVVHLVGDQFPFLKYHTVG